MTPNKPNSRILVFDGDTPLFRKALGLQTSYVEVWYGERMIECENLTHFKGGKINGKVIVGELENINKDRDKPFELEDFNIIEKVKPIDCENDRQRLAIGKRNMRMYISDFYTLPWVKEIKYCLSSETNFRKTVDPSYKSTRKEKPLLFLELREWFCKEFKDIITISKHVEADDLLSVQGYWSRNHFKNPKDSNIVLCGYDKDLLQIYNNWHFNFDKMDDGLIWVDEFSGNKNLCIQLLMGDNTDCIKGLPGINQGIKDKYGVSLGGCAIGKANKILSNCESVEALFKAVEDCYMMYYQDEWKQALSIQYKLVKLMDKMGEIPEYNFNDDK